MSEPCTLECDHCGGPAIESPDCMFGDGDGGACITCGMPGSVGIDDGGSPEEHVAYWRTSDDENDRCHDPDCVVCQLAPERQRVPFPTPREDVRYLPKLVAEIFAPPYFVTVHPNGECAVSQWNGDEWYELRRR